MTAIPVTRLGSQSGDWYPGQIDLGRPHSLVASPADLDVLDVLARTGTPLSGREIARRAGRSQEWTRHVMERLAEHGIVERERGGSAWLYELNRQHLAAPALDQLTSLRGLLLDRLRDAVRGWEIPPVGAALFGSAARGDGGVDSDVDLLVIRPDRVGEEDEAWRAQVDALIDGVRSWTGNPASVVELGAGDLRHLLDRSPPVLDSIRADAIDLAGRPVRTLLREAR